MVAEHARARLDGVYILALLADRSPPIPPPGVHCCELRTIGLPRSPSPAGCVGRVSVTLDALYNVLCDDPETASHPL